MQKSMFRRRDNSRTDNDIWVKLADHKKTADMKIMDNFKQLEELGYYICDFKEMDDIWTNYFIQFSAIPLQKDGGEKAIVLTGPYKRVPKFVVDHYIKEVFILEKDEINRVINERISLSSDQLVFTKDTKSLEAIKSILVKMERMKSSDVTISWRRSKAVISYAVSGRNIKDYEDSVTLEFAEKIRVSLINMSYENQANKLIDGKFSIHILGEIKEYRLSVMETVAGAAIVIRSYQKFDSEMSLDQLGYMEKPQKMIENILENNPYGVFLITGPTGSGKTTTIYTIINEAFKKHNLKIKTAEDPVEIEINGIDQCQINKKGDVEHQVTYVNLLRSFMRQRPDIIVIGEIRDRDVAISTIEAALTGHVVISTLHTNNVESSFTRLQTTLGISQDRIEDSMSGVLSQKLVDKLCDCKIKSGKGYKANEEGCDICKDNPKPGYNGQIPAVEIAELEKKENNFLKENFLEYYSYQDSAKDLYENGMIDLATKKYVEKH
jgi:type II secretory ATPase GspE/PulE/Tfp pilus assembly ATPase PilB-like protein